MILQSHTEKGWTEVIIDQDCEFDKFYEVADILQSKFGLLLTDKLNDFDTLYWDFDYNNSKLILHYNIYEGLTILPRAFKEASTLDNQNTVAIGKLVFESLIDLDWDSYANSNTIGKRGSESGIILQDFENLKGARITLEKDCNGIPFAITLGIYGVMFHTHFEKDLDTANDYIKNSKYKINKLFDLYSIPEERQSDLWEAKKNKLLQELADM
jgi:hypothetical protein